MEAARKDTNSFKMANFKTKLTSTINKLRHNGHCDTLKIWTETRCSKWMQGCINLPQQKHQLQNTLDEIIQQNLYPLSAEIKLWNINTLIQFSHKSRKWNITMIDYLKWMLWSILGSQSTKRDQHNRLICQYYLQDAIKK